MIYQENITKISKETINHSEIPSHEIHKSTQQTQIYVWGNDGSGQLGTSDYSFSSHYISPRFLKYQIRVVKISCGFEHTLLLSEMGNVYVMGSNKNGQLGLGKIKKMIKPAMLDISRKEKVWKISAGAHHSLICTSEKELYAFGKNNKGQLGLGDTQDRCLPRKVPNLSGVDIYYLNAGKHHSALIDNEQNLFIWGSNKYGQLGLGIKDPLAMFPVKFVSDLKIQKVKCGYQNTMLLTEDYEVFICGNNNRSQIVESLEENVYEFYFLEELENIERIFCTNFFLALSRDFTCYVWGGNEESFCPFRKPTILEEFEKKVVEASIGDNFIVLIDTDLLVYTCGKNDKGQLGYGDSLKENVFGCIDKINQHPIKDVECGKDFVLGLSGILTANPNKQIALSQNKSEASFYQYKQGKSQFNIYQDHVTDKSESDRPERKRVSEAVNDFKTHVYSLLDKITKKEPKIDQMIDRKMLQDLLAKEKYLNTILEQEDDQKERYNITKIMDELIKDFDSNTFNAVQKKKFLILLKKQRQMISFKKSNLHELAIKCSQYKSMVKESIGRIDEMLQSAYLLQEESMSVSDDSIDHLKFVQIDTEEEQLKLLNQLKNQRVIVYRESLLLFHIETKTTLIQ